jgi:hypothetical protein
MSRSTIFPFVCLILIMLIWTGCEPFFKPVLPPGISIYKTKGEYFDHASIGMKKNEIFRTSIFSGEKSKFIISDTDTVYKSRTRLENGYILDFEADSRYDVFLDLTFKQHMALEKIYSGGIPHVILRSHILDNNPYVEFFRDSSEPRKFGHTVGTVDTSELNTIIREGKLEQYFYRLK